MKQSTIIGFLLTFVMLLLVLGAAIFFLIDRTADQDQQIDNLSASQSALAATSTQEIVVLDAVKDDAQATRDVLAAQATQQAGLPQANADLAAVAANQATALAQSQPPAVVITQPLDQARVTPGQSLDIVLGARAGKGLAEISVTVNGQPLRTIAGEGQNVLPALIPWTPPAEATYTIQALATDTEGRESLTEIVTVIAAFENEAARDLALQEQLTGSLLATRFPEPEATATAVKLNPALHQLLAAGWESDSSDAVAREALVLQAFELVPSAKDYVNYVDDILTQPLLGYFDPDQGITTVFETTEPDATFAFWLELHGLAHAYQNDRFQLDQIDFTQLETDQRTAVRALAEGEANWLQYLALQEDAFSEAEKRDIDTALVNASTDSLNGLPTFLQQDFIFAYKYGLPFIQALYGDDNPVALDESWRNQPESSEHILHPDRYLAQDSPQEITLLPLGDILDDAWQLIDDGTLGEWRLRQHLNQYLDPAQAEESAAGWGGDRYLLYWHGEDDVPLLVLRLGWDSASDRAEFSRLYTNYLTNRSGGSAGLSQDSGRCWLGSDVVCLYPLEDDQSLVVKAPNLNIAGQIFEQLSNAN